MNKATCMEVLWIDNNRKSFAGESFARASNYLHDKSIQGAEVKGPPGATEMQKAHTAPPPVLQAKKSQERPKKPLRPKETSSSFALASNWATAQTTQGQ